MCLYSCASRWALVSCKSCDSRTRTLATSFGDHPLHSVLFGARTRHSGSFPTLGVARLRATAAVDPRGLQTTSPTET